MKNDKRLLELDAVESAQSAESEAARGYVRVTEDRHFISRRQDVERHKKPPLTVYVIPQVSGGYSVYPSQPIFPRREDWDGYYYSFSTARTEKPQLRSHSVTVPSPPPISMYFAFLSPQHPVEVQ